MIEEGQEYTTPLYDEDGELIEVIEDYDVFLDEEIPEEEHDDAYYAGEEGDLAEEDYAEENNVDPVESRILTASERYTTARDSVIERLTQILENGEITAEDNADLNEAMFEYTESVTDMKDKLNEVEHGNNDTNGINQGTVTTVLPEELQHLIDLMNNGGRNDLLFVDEEGRVLVEGEQVPKLKLVELEVEKLIADYAEIEDLVAKKATIEDLNAVKAQIGTLEAGEIIADIIHGNVADIGDLTADIGKINTLVGGNLTMENIQSLILTAKKVTVEDAFIKDAMIDTVNANKVNTGSINTNLVGIESEDGSLTLNGTLQQFKDENGKVRIQMGKDAQGNFTFGLFDSTGTGTLIDSNGITEKAIGDGIIVDKMVGDDANISGGKLDIASVVTEVNNGTTTIKGSKVKLDTQNQTLDVAFTGMSSTVTEQGKTVSNHTTSISTMEGDISTLISDTTIIEEGNKVTVKDAYSTMKQDVGEFGISLKEVESNFNNMEIGTRNLVANSAPLDLTGWSIPNGNWTMSLVDCASAVKGKAIRSTCNSTGARGGVYIYPINKDGLKNGATYTVTALIRASKNGLRINVHHEQMITIPLFTIGTNWQLITYTEKVDTSKSQKAIIFYTNAQDSIAEDWFEVHSLMFSKSTKQVDWVDAPEEIASIDSRVRIAESKLTLEGLKTTIGSTYTTPKDVDNQVGAKGYATTAGVTQAVDNFTLKFKESGGYNELYNGNFKNGYTNWATSGLATIITNGSCPDNQISARLGGTIGGTTAIAQRLDDLNSQSKFTLSLWSFVESSGSNGTTNTTLLAQVTVEYTDGTKTYPGIRLDSKFDTWERKTIVMTPTTGKRIKSMYLEIICRDTSRVMYITDVILSKGSLEVPFAPNPNEVFDGITTISKDGMKVEQSNYNGYTQMKADGFYVNDGTKDVIRQNKDGLYVSGQIHVESGSISESALAGTIIDGQYIKTDTILARSIKIGDFTNYCTKPSNYTMTGAYNGQLAYLVGTRANQGMDASEHLTHLAGGEVFNISGKVYAPPENTAQTNFNIYFYWVGNNVNLGSALVAQACTPSTATELNLTLTVPARPVGAEFGYFRITCGNANFNLYWMSPNIRLMMSGSLIVDGAIDGKLIKGAEIRGGLIRSIDENIDGNPLFSLDSIGNILGANIQGTNLNIEGDITGDTLNINYIGNSRYPEILDEDISVSINTSATSDTDFFDGAVYASLADLHDAIPRNLNGYTLTIDFVTDYTGNLAFTKFNSGHVYINFNKKQIRGYVWLYGESMRYNVYGNNKDATGTATNCANMKPSKGREHAGYAYTIIVDYCHVNLYDLNIYPGVDTTVTPSGIVVTNQSTAYLSNIRAFGNPQHLVRSHACSQVYVASSDGLTNSNTFSAVSGSVQCLNNTNQAGTNSTTIKETYTTGNSQIFATGVTFASASNSGSNDSGSSTTETINVTVKATSGNTYRRTVYNSWKNDGVVRQGDYGYGDCDGFWFFGTQISKYANKNITKVTITIKRNTGAGSTGPVSHTVVGHNYSSKPSGTPSAMGSAIRTFSLSAGNSVALNLTPAEITTFKSYKGIGLKSAYTSGNYSACSATCTIKITYVE